MDPLSFRLFGHPLAGYAQQSLVPPAWCKAIAFPPIPPQYQSGPVEPKVIYGTMPEVQALCSFAKTKGIKPFLECGVPGTPAAPGLAILPTPQAWPCGPESYNLLVPHSLAHARGWAYNHPR